MTFILDKATKERAERYDVFCQKALGRCQYIKRHLKGLKRLIEENIQYSKEDEFSYEELLDFRLPKFDSNDECVSDHDIKLSTLDDVLEAVGSLESSLLNGTEDWQELLDVECLNRLFPEDEVKGEPINQ